MIAIPNMDKPKNCKVCPFTCEKLAFFDGKNTPQGCPLIDIVRCGECKHRDPEDKKCDSGMLERAGCIFPVDDDYFCKYGERRAKQ